MLKVLVAEIDNKSTVVNAFGDLNTENPKKLGQGISSTTADNGDIGIGVKCAVSNLENNIGPAGSLEEIPLYVISWLTEQSVIQETSFSEFNCEGRIFTAPQAIMKSAQLIYEEVGDVIVLDVSGASTTVYSITAKRLAQQTVEEDLGLRIPALTLVKLIGEGRIKEHYGQDWKEILNSELETTEKIALNAELVSAAVSIALQRHSSGFIKDRNSVLSVEMQNLRRIRWIVGTGLALTQLPNALDIMKESIKEMNHPLLSHEGIAVMLDKDCLMASLGVLASTYRAGAWELLRESFGVEN
ncbi:MAG TPA: hypothetical protein DEF42_07220 [Desulfosporosinus sp.]|nr:hypothetical protein [Desulfosporosinus sp.]